MLSTMRKLNVFVLLASTLATGCVKVEVAPIKATIDVNFVDKSLDDFYSYQKPTTRPTSIPAVVVPQPSPEAK
jgi:hypothetical protein